MNKFSNQESKWRNDIDRLEVSIKSGEDVPEEVINRFMKFTRKLFEGTPYLQPAEDRAFELHRKWNACNLKKERERKLEEMRNTEQPVESMDTKIELEKSAADSIRDAISKIAAENNIIMADKVIIKLSSNEGIVRFKGIENK